MSGQSDQERAANEAIATSSRLSREGYGIGIPAIHRQQGLLQTALAQGEPEYLQEAFGRSRALQGDAAAASGLSEVAQARGIGAKAAGGGNLGAQQAMGQGYGQKLAQAMFSSRINEAQGNVEQMDKLLGMTTGAAQQAGSASLAAESNAMGAIPFMRQYDPTYATMVGALNAGGVAYGAANQAGLFNKPPANNVPSGWNLGM